MKYSDDKLALCITQIFIKILFWPFLFIGAIAGGTLAYLCYRNKFKSIFEVFDQDFTEEEKEEFMDNIQEFIRKFGINDALMLINLAQGNVNFQREMFHVIKMLLEQWQENRNAEPRAK